MNYAQTFCSVADLIADKPAIGVDEARMLQAIREASDFIVKHPKGGWFIPVTLTRRYTGNGSTVLRIPPSLLAIDSLTNDEVSVPSTDYILKPDDGFWPNGPYGELRMEIEATTLSRWSCERDEIVITGQYGKYNETADTGTAVRDDPQSDAQTTLKVSNGAVVSPGMVLLIEDEQESVTGWGDPTENVTALNGSIDANDEIIVVDNAALINIGEIIQIGFEDCRVKNKRLSSHQLEVQRGWNGTSRVTHADNAAVDVYRTVTVDRGVNGTASTSHVLGTKIYRYCVPSDILGLVKELATLSVNKAQSGYQGRTGNQDTGVVFYNDHLPRYDINAVLNNYYIPRFA